jgi:hypothetical protein
MNSYDSDLAKRNRLVCDLVSLLSQGRFDEVIRLAPGSRVSAVQLQEEVSQYGRHLVPLPLGAYKLIDYVGVVGTSPLEWSVVVPLFTEEEGRSDLSLELSVVEGPDGNHTLYVDGLRVL